jgi:tRNA pseudouridine55 synthase
MPIKGGKIPIDEKELKKKIKQLKGNYTQKIPMYSSIRVKGKPLFYYARKGKTENIQPPEFVVSIKEIQIEDVFHISSQKLLKDIIKKINNLEGDFRQEEIINAWKNILENSEEKYKVIQVRIACSSGTYIRAIAEDIGKTYGGGMLISLQRTKVGRFDVRDSLKISGVKRFPNT